VKAQANSPVQAFSFQCCSRPGAALVPQKAEAEHRIAVEQQQVPAEYVGIVWALNCLLITGAPSQSGRESSKQPAPEAKQGKVATQSAATTSDTTPGPPGTATSIPLHPIPNVGPAFQPFRNSIGWTFWLHNDKRRYTVS